jgi:hypothetical protein
MARNQTMLTARSQVAFWVMFAGLALLAPTAAQGGSVTAGVDAFATLPPALGGDTSITLPGLNGDHPIFLEGANETQFCNASHCISNTPLNSLTPAELAQLAMKAPSLASGLVTYQIQWVDAHGAVVGPTSQHAVGTSVVPVFMNPNFDTVVQRVNTLTFTKQGQTLETPIDIAMLNLQSVNTVTIGGFRYEILVQLTNGPVDPQFTGNIALTATTINSSGVFGTINMGATGPAPTTADLGENLPPNILGLPVSYDLIFDSLDGGPTIPSMTGEIIFQNPTLGSFKPIPEPSSVMLLGIGAVGLIWRLRRRC